LNHCAKMMMSDYRFMLSSKYTFFISINMLGTSWVLPFSCFYYFWFIHSCWSYFGGMLLFLFLIEVFYFRLQVFRYRFSFIEYHYTKDTSAFNRFPCIFIRILNTSWNTLLDIFILMLDSSNHVAIWIFTRVIELFGKLTV